MSKVPNFYKFYSNGSSIVENIANDKNFKWVPFFVNTYIPDVNDDQTFSITFRVNQLDKYKNTWSLAVGILKINEDDNVNNVVKHLENKFFDFVVGSERENIGISYVALKGKFVGVGINDSGEIYRKYDEIKINVYNKFVEFFKNNNSQGKFSISDWYSYLPVISTSSTSNVEIIDIRIFDNCEEELQENNNENN
eukprot:TRINITY_DN2912_c0_g1_i1.p1 TRINITY_DN2912_c0_g1~~TRINITY_DN2912_c0_g1_i1.p1  ORF type:complete len:195 (+),score=50.05 TRINITY_DN2912_c0_g1_i1:97-681(+)